MDVIYVSLSKYRFLLCYLTFMYFVCFQGWQITCFRHISKVWMEKAIKQYICIHLLIYIYTALLALFALARESKNLMVICETAANGRSTLPLNETTQRSDTSIFFTAFEPGTNRAEVLHILQTFQGTSLKVFCRKN